MKLSSPFSNLIFNTFSTHNERSRTISSLVQLQKQLVTQTLAEAKNFIKEGDDEKGGFKLLQTFRIAAIRFE